MDTDEAGLESRLDSEEHRRQRHAESREMSTLLTAVQNLVHDALVRSASQN